jgi:hypothetical protein
MYEATETFGRTRAPLGLVWLKGTQRVLSLGLEKALSAGARVDKGHEGPGPRRAQGRGPLGGHLLPGRPSRRGGGGAQEIGRIRAQVPNATILVSALAPDLRLARGAIKAGASGLIHTGMTPEQTLRALWVALRGEVVLPRALLRLWADEQRRLEPSRSLSPPEGGPGARGRGADQRRDSGAAVPL